MADRDPAGTQITRKAGETQTAADIPAQINNEPVASLATEIPHCHVECVREADPRGSREEGDLEKPGFGSGDSMNRTLGLDDRRAVLSALSEWNANGNLARVFTRRA